MLPDGYDGLTERSPVLFAAADLEVMFPLLYNFVGSKRNPEPIPGQAAGLVTSRPSSHVILREAVPGSEDNVSRFILEFQCKSDGKDLPLHSSKVPFSALEAFITLCFTSLQHVADAGCCCYQACRGCFF